VASGASGSCRPGGEQGTGSRRRADELAPPIHTAVQRATAAPAEMTVVILVRSSATPLPARTAPLVIVIVGLVSIVLDEMFNHDYHWTREHDEQRRSRPAPPIVSCAGARPQDGQRRRLPPGVPVTPAQWCPMQHSAARAR